MAVEGSSGSLSRFEVDRSVGMLLFSRLVCGRSFIEAMEGGMAEERSRRPIAFAYCLPGFLVGSWSCRWCPGLRIRLVSGKYATAIGVGFLPCSLDGGSFRNRRSNADQFAGWSRTHGPGRPRVQRLSTRMVGPFGRIFNAPHSGLDPACGVLCLRTAAGALGFVQAEVEEPHSRSFVDRAQLSGG